MSEDWLEPAPPAPPAAVAGLPAVVTIPDDYPARLALLEQYWSQLTLKQKTFLQTWRDCRYNARAAARQLSVSRSPHTEWLHNDRIYATVVRIWRANAAASALDRDRLLARQDDIVETLLTPKPILHQGVPTGFEEVEAAAASRANEVLLDRVMPKPRADVEVNVGVVAFAPPRVEVEGASNEALEAQCEVVEADVVLPPDESWLET